MTPMPRAGKDNGRFSHGHAGQGKKTRTYKIWCGMLTRVRNPCRESYARYGGAGVSASEDWSSFASFLRDMGEAPDGATIDRIDPAKGYCAANCHWLPAAEQSANRRNVRFAERKDGTLVPVCTGLRQLGLPPSSFLRREKRGETLDNFTKGELKLCPKRN